MLWSSASSLSMLHDSPSGTSILREWLNPAGVPVPLIARGAAKVAAGEVKDAGAGEETARHPPRRDGTAPFGTRGRFAGRTKGAVTDPSSGLMWQQGREMLGKNAPRYCAELSRGGFHGWRLNASHHLLARRQKLLGKEMGQVFGCWNDLVTRKRLIPIDLWSQQEARILRLTTQSRRAHRPKLQSNC